jgi:lipoate-protein ligase A
MSSTPESGCRVIVDPAPLTGTVNMAIDGALLRAAVEQPAAPVVRIYQWSEPTISLGYFQTHDTSSSTEALNDCPRVHRLTGGGAILHHHDLTYSCVVPRTHPMRHEPIRLYDVVHRTISRLLMSCGAKVGFRANFPAPHADSGRSVPGRSQPFLCFLRSDPRDLAAIGDNLLGHPKITGSAQRRRRGSILQHGSILLKSSALLPDVPGILDLFPAFDTAAFLRTLPERLATSVSDRQIASEYTVPERRFTFEILESIRSDSTVTQSMGLTPRSKCHKVQ